MVDRVNEPCTLTSMGDERRLTARQRRELDAVSTEAFGRLRARRGALLTELRAQGWSLPELARLLGVSKQRIAALLRARD